MSNTFTMGEVVEILNGKFRGTTGTVVTIHQDKNGIERVQVSTSSGIFSYMANSVKSTGSTTTTKTTEVAENSGEGFSFGEGF